MHHRIHQALDGELPVDGLTPEERAELHRYRASIGTALGPIRQLPSIDVSSEVMTQVAHDQGRVRRIFNAFAVWLWSPRALTVRPAFALAGVAAIVAVVSTSLLQSATAVHPAPPAARVIVQFRLGDPAARQVALAGDFNGWQPEHQLHQVAAGVWSVDIALEPGVYNYVFVVDGKAWRLDPLAPRVTDGFGGASSRLAVLPPQVRS
jgi:Glycogen recognition site of AMP-activated protein kinase